MSDPYIMQLGSVEDADGEELTIGVNYDTVTLDGRSFSASAAAALAGELAVACCEAGRHAERQRAELDAAGHQPSRAVRTVPLPGDDQEPLFARSEVGAA